MKKAIFSGVLLLFILLQSCGPSKQAGNQKKVVQLDEVVVMPVEDNTEYRASYTRKTDLIHTRLDVKLNIPEERLMGSAQISFKPHFYLSDSLILDAKKMDIHKVALSGNGGKETPLTYSYDSTRLRIFLGRKYSRFDTLTVSIDYTAVPSRIRSSTGEAITDAKGLYFINPKGTEKNKPTQVWTQGETESNSCWFPTIEATNQRMTQELCITVDSGFVSLSNGILVYSIENPDGSHTDCWKQSLPAAPYLTMFAIGDFAITKDKWKNKEVSYYTERKYAPYAKRIFGRTPEMLEFFSNRLGVEYPWEKFSQICVRDFVSGAMENTSAVVHGSSLQKYPSQWIDDSREEYISHELFHQWFGDLVTCESWSNIPLNESFATYGEYLWNEFKHGKEEADYYLNHDLETFIRTSKQKDVGLIRYYYNDKEEMFDGISYQKGGLVLNALRNYVGDDAFFYSLQQYLKEHQFQPVEIHDLRLAFEKVTGEDLNWFFNQWFLSKGFPELEIHYNFNESLKKCTVTIEQKQAAKYPTFRIPMKIDLYYSGTKETHNVVLDKRTQGFSFDVSVKPNLVNVDADKILPGLKKDNHSKSEWAFQYYHAPLLMDRLEAAEYFFNLETNDSTRRQFVLDALSDKHWALRKAAIHEAVDFQADSNILKEKLSLMAKRDADPAVRASAIEALSYAYTDPMLISVYSSAVVSDSSENVIGAALYALQLSDPNAARELAEKFSSEHRDDLLSEVAHVFSFSEDHSQFDFFRNAISRGDEMEIFSIIGSFGSYLSRTDSVTFEKGLEFFDKTIMQIDPWWLRSAGASTISVLPHSISERIDEFELKLRNAKEQDKAALVSKIAQLKRRKVIAEHFLDDEKNKNKDQRLRKYFDGK